MNLTEYKASLPYAEALVTWPCPRVGWIQYTHSRVRYSRSVLLLSFNLRVGRPDYFVQDSPPEAHMVFSSSPCAQHAPPTTFLMCLSSYYCRSVQVMKLIWAGSSAFVYLLYHGGRIPPSSSCFRPRVTYGLALYSAIRGCVSQS